MVLPSLFSTHALEGRLVACLYVHEATAAGITLHIVASWGLGLASLLDGADSMSVACGWVLRHDELQKVYV